MRAKGQETASPSAEPVQACESLNRPRFARPEVPKSLFLLVLFLIVGGLTIPRFLTIGNLTNVAEQDSILIIAALGQAIVIITGGIDLSAGSAVGLISVVTVLTVNSSGLTVGVIFGVLAGLAVGVINGFLVGPLAIPAFLVTFGMLTVAEGIADLLAGGAPVAGPPRLPLAVLATGDVHGVPVAILVVAGVAACVYAILRRTSLGRSWYLIGVNRRAAGLAGIRVSRALFGAYVIAGILVVLAGLMLTGRVDSGQPGLDTTLAFDAIAACAIGGLPLAGGSGTILEVLAGATILSLADNAVVLLNFSAQWQLVLTGTIIIVAVVAQKWRVSPRNRSLSQVRHLLRSHGGQ